MEKLSSAAGRASPPPPRTCILERPEGFYWVDTARRTGEITEHGPFATLLATVLDMQGPAAVEAPAPSGGGRDAGVAEWAGRENG